MQLSHASLSAVRIALLTIIGCGRAHFDVLRDTGTSDATSDTDSGTLNLDLLMWDKVLTRIGYHDDYFTARTELPILSTPGQWHYVSMTYEAGHAVTYADGVLTTDIMTPRVVTPPCKISIGQEWDGTTVSDRFVGLIDELTVWSVAKTPAQLAADMAANATGSEPDLLAYFPFDSTADASGHGHQLALQTTAALVPLP